MRRRSQLPLFLLIGLTLLVVPLRAQEWTRFRGPNGSGISTAKTVPVAFTETDLNWRVELPGSGHSSPVIWKDRIFVTSADERAPSGQGKRYLLCIRAADGKKIWSRSFPFSAYQRHSFNNAASSTPAVDADHVYVVWPAPEAVVLCALNHQGKEIWRQDLGPYPALHGGGMSPIVVGAAVVVTKEPEEGQGLLLGLDRKSGRVRWKRERFSKDAAYSTPLVYQPKGAPPEVIYTGATGITSINPSNGSLLWEVRDIFRARCVGSPVLANGLIFATAGNGGGDRQAAAVRPRSYGQPAEIVYQPTKGVGYVPTPIAVGDRLFLWGDGGIVTCLRASDGQEIWVERVGGRFFGSPVCVDGRLYAVSVLGEVVVIAAGDEFQVLGRSQLGEESHATPAVSGGVMYLRTVGHLISVGGKKPASS